MEKISINLSKKYDCLIGKDLLSRAGELISDITQICKVMLVSDDIVFPLYGETVVKSLKNAGFLVETFVFKNGEKHKNIDTVGELLEKMCAANMTRTDIIVALGGGVVGDLAGFGAAIYQRGIKFVQIPTTLLAAVDSSVGGKTGVDLKGGKNQIGAFWQPSLVICDINTFDTLPKEQYACGCAEIIKYAVISSEEFFIKLNNTPVKDMYEEVVSTCVKTKRDYVLEDEFDTGVRMFLNFGHTFGHAVEACSNFKILHGQAVAIGMAFITSVAVKKGICKADTYDRLLSILKKYDLPIRSNFNAEEIKKTMLVDKKNAGDNIRLIVPQKIGKCKIESVKKDEIDSHLTLGCLYE